MKSLILALSFSACAIDPRPEDPPITITLTWFCEAYGCKNPSEPPSCDSFGHCTCQENTCFVPSCDYPDDDPLYSLAVVKYAENGEPCLHDNNQLY